MPLSITWSTDQEEENEEGVTETSTTFHILEFDAVTRVIHEGTATVTERAVDRGSPISDHKRSDNRRITIEAMVTNTPLQAPPPSGFAASQVTAEVRGQELGLANVLVFSQDFDRVTDVADTLERLRAEPILVTVQTKLRTYEDALVVGLSEVEDGPEPDSQVFEITLQQIRIGETTEVDSPQPREPRGRRPVDDGAQATEDSEESGRGGTTAVNLADDFLAAREDGQSVREAALSALGFGE